jgi:hypothetical protein
MSQVYQGHLADGSSVQKHSAGPVYPFIVFAREGDAESGLVWCVIGPGIEGELRFASSLAAFGAAQRCKVVTENDDAWAFELEQLCMVALQRQEAMIGAANNLRPQRWQDMSKVQRVASLLNLGQVRATLKLPMIQPPLFAAYARALHAD